MSADQSSNDTYRLSGVNGKPVARVAARDDQLALDASDEILRDLHKTRPQSPPTVEPRRGDSIICSWTRIEETGAHLIDQDEKA